MARYGMRTGNDSASWPTMCTAANNATERAQQSQMFSFPLSLPINRCRKMYSSTKGPTTTSNGTISQAGTCCIRACRPAWLAEVCGGPVTATRTQVTIIAMGGAIGVGLFMGAGGRLASTGPALIFSYAIAGVIAYLLMRALGELIMYRQTSGSLVSYAGEMFGKKGAYMSGWMYFINWGMTGIAELIAIGLYFQFFFPNVPVEASAIAALALLVAVNLLSVKAFGEFEFWASCLKVGAILIFLAVGTFMVVSNAKVGGGHASVANLFADDGGMFPKGALVMVLVLNAVIFSYNGIELVGITAGEMENAKREVPKAIRAVVLRIVVFYVGSVLLLAMLLPSDQYKAGVSPFVTVFGQMGLGWVGDVMNMIVITAALSSCNSGLYSIGRVFRTMANNGHAPQWLTKMSKRHVPYAAILA